MIILRQNEKLIKIIRRHWIFVAPTIVFWVIFVVALGAIKFFIAFDLWGYWFWLMAVIAAVILLTILRKYYLWRANVLVITDQRVVENEQKGFFSKTVTELLFKDILEISYSKNGLNASLYNYGDIRIRTASEDDLIVPKIPDPGQVVEVINQTRLGFAEQNFGGQTRQGQPNA